MTWATGGVNVAMGAAYLAIGVLVLVDLARGWRGRGVSQMGLALVALAFTCGPHHLDHGLHLLADPGRAAPVELLTVVVGLPAGWAFAVLRVEAFMGKPGDREIAGTPEWVALLPAIGAMQLAVIVAATSNSGQAIGFDQAVIPNLALVALYVAIAVVLLRTQLETHRATASWSLSGLALTGIFITCAPMHAVLAFYVATGRYGADAHLLVIDWVGIPAAAYFLWVVRRLSSGGLHDWNRPRTTVA